MLGLFKKNLIVTDEITGVSLQDGEDVEGTATCLAEGLIAAGAGPYELSGLQLIIERGSTTDGRNMNISPAGINTLIVAVNENDEPPTEGMVAGATAYALASQLELKRNHLVDEDTLRTISQNAAARAINNYCQAQAWGKLGIEWIDEDVS